MENSFVNFMGYFWATIGKNLLLWTRMHVPDSDIYTDQIDEEEIQTFLKMKFPEDFIKASG